MSSRIRSCVECPNCHTRYLIGFSSHSNGSYIVSHPQRAAVMHRLYSTCSNSPSPYAFKFSKLKMYDISDWADRHACGSPEEIVLVRAATGKAS